MHPVTLQSVLPGGTRRPAGHYSPGIICCGMLYVSGQLPIDPETGDRENGSIEAQTKLVLCNLDRILLAAGSRRELVVQTTIYLSDVNLWDKVNAVYAEFFGEHRPARAVVPTAPLHYGFLIELSACAAIDTTGSNRSEASTVDAAVDSAGDVGG